MDSEPKAVVIKTGYLKKRSKYLHLWKTRFCILTNRHLFAFTGVSKDADCTMALLLSNYTNVQDAENDIGNLNSFSLEGKDGTYYFMSESKRERDDWVKAIQNQLMKNLNDNNQ